MIKNRTKFMLSLTLALSIFLMQVSGVFADSALQNRNPVIGLVQRITLEANTITGVTLVSIDVIDDNQTVQTVRVSLETAIDQGFVVLNGDGKPIINQAALGKQVEIDPSVIIPIHEENQHPVGSVLATFFSDITGLEYVTIMSAHEQGLGFGVIAQILWLTTKLEGSAETFEALIEAKQTGDFSAFVLEDGSTPKNWGQLQKAILAKDKNNSLGVIISDSNGNGNGNEKDKDNNGNGNGNGGGNGNNSDKSKDKDKGKDKKK